MGMALILYAAKTQLMRVVVCRVWQNKNKL